MSSSLRFSSSPPLSPSPSFSAFEEDEEEELTLPSLSSSFSCISATTSIKLPPFSFTFFSASCTCLTSRTVSKSVFGVMFSTIVVVFASASSVDDCSSRSCFPAFIFLLFFLLALFLERLSRPFSEEEEEGEEEESLLFASFVSIAAPLAGVSLSPSLSLIFSNISFSRIIFSFFFSMYSSITILLSFTSLKLSATTCTFLFGCTSRLPTIPVLDGRYADAIPTHVANVHIIIINATMKRFLTYTFELLWETPLFLLYFASSSSSSSS